MSVLIFFQKRLLIANYNTFFSFVLRYLMLLEFFRKFAEAYESRFKVVTFCKTFPHDDN